MKFIFSDGSESPLYGTETSDQVVLGASFDSGKIIGLYGRSGDELDRMESS